MIFGLLVSALGSGLAAGAPGLTRRALGVYNTLQSLGLVAGIAFGGWIPQLHGVEALFMRCGGMMLLWLLIAWPMTAPNRSEAAALARASAGKALAGQPVKL